MANASENRLDYSGQSDVSAKSLNRRIYAGLGLFPRILQIWRPIFCPLSPIAAAVPRGGRILDLGCGRGMLLLNLAAQARFESAVGIEISEQLITEAKEALARLAAETGLQPNIDFRSRPSARLLEAGETFSTVLLIDVLHHVHPASQESFLRSAMAVVSPGGTLVYKDMSAKPRWCALGNRIHDLVVAKQWVHYFPSERVIRVLAEDPSWELVSTRRYRRLWYCHELLVACRKPRLCKPAPAA